VLLPVRLARGERLFVLWAGLKGAVPILLGSFLLTAGVPDASRLYAVIIVVVASSVIVQGGLVPTVAASGDTDADRGTRAVEFGRAVSPRAPGLAPPCCGGRLPG
jgi:NhaP-type Na+/H+ and K+/H+ antiporter